MTDIIIILVLMLWIGGAIAYIRKKKKQGVKCVGCPYAESCAKRTAGACSAKKEGME